MGKPKPPTRPRNGLKAILRSSPHTPTHPFPFTPPPLPTPVPSTTSEAPFNTSNLSIDLSQTLTLSDSQSQLLTPQFSTPPISPRTPIPLSPGDEYTSSDRGLLGFFNNAREPETRMPRGWFEGNWDGVADCEPNEPDQGREFLLAGHVNLNRSGACAAMFAKHQSDEAKKFRIDKRGNITSRVNLPPNKRREGRPLSVSEWRAQGGHNPGLGQQARERANRPPPTHDPLQSRHHMTTRARSACLNAQANQRQAAANQTPPKPKPNIYSKYIYPTNPPST